ncbi:MAG: helix-turn-helix domain-containing protein [Cellulomonas sp.]|nr:helix-turn-helix domain-containing protein [Cellulomonas sp.]
MTVETARWREAVSATIRAERAARRLTQDEVVARTGIPKPTYLRYEHGQRLPDLAVLAAIANDAFGVPLSVLVSLVAARAETD